MRANAFWKQEEYKLQTDTAAGEFRRHGNRGHGTQDNTYDVAHTSSCFSFPKSAAILGADGTFRIIALWLVYFKTSASHIVARSMLHTPRL